MAHTTIEQFATELKLPPGALLGNGTNAHPNIFTVLFQDTRLGVEIGRFPPEMTHQFAGKILYIIRM